MHTKGYTNLKGTHTHTHTHTPAHTHAHRHTHNKREREINMLKKIVRHAHTVIPSFKK